MERDAYRKLVSKLERRAQRRPRLYRAQVVALALLGYLFIPTTIALLTSVVVVTAVMSVSLSNPVPLIAGLLITGALGLPFVRSLFVQIPPPEGLVLTRAAAPDLWTVIDSHNKVLRAPSLHGVLVVSQFNAAMVQHPARGLRGGHENYLLLGLPLMLGLSDQQVETVIAHELAHLSRDHGGVANWVFRVRATWSRLGEVLVTPRKSNLMWAVGRFAAWYFPRLEAASLVLSRRHELEADRLASAVVGVDRSAESLMALDARTPQLERFWEAIDRRAMTEPQPPATVFADLERALAEPVDESMVRAQYGRVLSMRTDEYSTHPCLVDRLDAIGYLKQLGMTLEAARETPTALADRIPLPTPGEMNGARRFLGRDFDVVVVKLESQWRHFAAEGWIQRHREQVENVRKLAELEVNDDGAPQSGEAIVGGAAA